VTSFTMFSFPRSPSERGDHITLGRVPSTQGWERRARDRRPGEPLHFAV